MKNTLTLFLAVTSITLSVVCVMQTRKFGGQQTQLVSLQAQVDEKAQEIETLHAAQKRSDQQRHELLGQAEELAAQLQAHQPAEATVAVAAPTNAPPVSAAAKPDDEKGGFGKMLSKMMQDPEARKLIRNQQRMMMDQTYAPLVKNLGLTPEESTQFKDMLADNAMKVSEKAFSMFDGSSPTNRAELASAQAADQKSFDEQMKGFLGDARYAQYEDYQSTVGVRMQLNAFKQQAGSDYNLNDQQTEALLTFMKEEQKSVAATTGLPVGGDDKDKTKLMGLLSDNKVDELLAAQDTVSQRVYERARTILSPDQLDTLGKFQTNQMQMMRMGMTMAKKMFAPDKPAADEAPPSQ
jgi:hypothetical protein